MKKLSVSILFLMAVFLTFNSCRKDYSNEIYTPEAPTKPDLATKINASVSGFITDENDKAVEGAVISVGTQTISSDKYGYFKISNVAVSKTAGFIKVSKPGYFNGFRTFVAKEGKETFTRLKLIPKINTGTINSATGGTITSTDGSSVTLPANAVVVAANGTRYSGTINIATHLIDPTSNDIALNIPGGLIGIDTAGYLKVLQSFGMLAVELTDASGNLLQIANGKQATLNFPVPSSLTSSAPATIPLWYLDETNGLWKEESAANKTGNNYIGNVKHFSYWNCDIGYSPVSFTAQVVDSSLHPLANTEISVRGNQFSSYNHGFTDTSGFIYGMVPANADLSLNVLTPCGTSVYSKNFSTNSYAVDLGTIAIKLKQFQLIINGQVVNCNNESVINGFVITNFNGCNNISTITNGLFNINTTTCSNSIPTIATLVAIDNSTLQASELKTINLISGTNNTVTLSACSADTLQYVSYTFDDTTTTLTIPPCKALYGGYIENSQTTAITLIANGVNGSLFSMEITGGTTIDNNHTVKAGVNLLSKGIYFPFPVSASSETIVNITKYDSIGGFISGNFMGQVYNVYDGTHAPHSLNCTFRIRRQY